MSVKLERIRKRVGDFELRDVNLSVEKGEYFVILGPIGAGKTLLLQIVAGFLRPDEGRVFLDGEDITDLPPEKRRIGYVPQHYGLFPHMTVEENVAFGLKMRKVERREIEEKVGEVLKLLDIDHLKDRYPETLSGGERRKVALARAMVVEPSVYLLDEPLTGVDPREKEKLRRELRELHRSLNKTFIHVTHDQAEASLLADHIAVMREGRIVQVGSVDEVFRNPSDEFVAKFVGFKNLFRGEVIEAREGIAVIDIGGPKVEAVTERKGTCLIGIRPDDIILALEPPKSSMRNVLKGRVVGYDKAGAFAEIRVDVGGVEFVALITRASFDELKLEVGKEVYVCFKASAVKVL